MRGREVRRVGGGSAFTFLVFKCIKVFYEYLSINFLQLQAINIYFY